MPITANDLRWFRSERMTDNDDGGGQMTSNEIFSGQENQIFDDLSDVDRAAGDVSIRKVYAAVASADDAKYLDAGVVVFKAPADPDVSVTAFSTGDYYDERVDLKNRLESGIARGSRYQGYLWGQHIAGQRAIVLWQRESSPLPAIGARLEMVLMSSTQSNATVVYNQFLWVTAITEELVERYDTEGLYRVRMVVCELAEPLAENYTGTEPQRLDISNPLTMVYETRYNHDAVPIVGIRPLVEAAETLDYSLRVDSLYTPLIPTAFAETALPDTNPGGDTASLVAAASGTVSFTTALNCVGPNLSLYLGMGALPGTVVITSSGTTITDQGGVMRLAGVDVGRIDYGNGVATFNASCPALGTNAKTVVFRPACKPLRVADTEILAITVENRGLVYVITLAPIPAPGTLRVSYMVNGGWYVLSDNGAGVLSGADSSYGSGTLNYSTGTVVLTCGELPDVDSAILFSWATPIAYFDRSGTTGKKLRVSGTVANPGVVPGTVTVTAPGVSLTDSNGVLSGTGGAGQIDYITGEWWVEPETVPAMGTEFEIGYQYGELVDEEIAYQAPDESGAIPFALANPPVPGTIRADWQVKGQREYLGGFLSTGRATTDDGAGAFSGSTGSINYATGEGWLGVNDSTSYQVPIYEMRETPCDKYEW